MTAERLAELRKYMKQEGVNWWYISGSDPHQSENVAPCWRSREYLSAFTGSAGRMLIAEDRALLWVDSRYYLQADAETDSGLITVMRDGETGVPGLEDYLKDNVQNLQCVGFDGTSVSMEKYRQIQELLIDKDCRFFLKQDLLDRVWTDRPALPASELFELALEFSGRDRREKLAELREIMLKEKMDRLFISSLDDIAWLMNMRGEDVAYSPVAIAYCMVAQDSCSLFINEKRMQASLKRSLENDGVTLRPYEEAAASLRSLESVSLGLDPGRSSAVFASALSDNVTLVKGTDPTTKMKARKNEVEAAGMRNAHLEDGLSMMKWWRWFEENLGRIPMDEVSVTDKLAEFRYGGRHFMGLSFSPICGYGPNGAIVHYSAKKESAAHIRPEGILLLDSGGHYSTGTTDITRTFALSEPTPEQKLHYTLVLKGHIDLAMCIFPVGSSGARIEVLARQPLWHYGLNYGHGTGHGVGHFLNVHEGPAGISPRNQVPLEAGMVMSNEPGCYLEGQYGIRIENLVIVREHREYDGYLYFEDLTLFPYDLNLIDSSLLTKAELNFVNSYHARVYSSMKDSLQGKDRDFLKKKTREL